MADTGPLPAATFEIRVLLWSAQGLDLLLEWVGADGATVLKGQVIPARWPVPSWSFEVTIAPDQRIRLRARAVGVGDTQVSLFWRPVRP